MIRKPTIATFYNKKQVGFDLSMDQSYSKSPIKPYLLMERIQSRGLLQHFEIFSDFVPYEQDDFSAAHTEEYVSNVFNQSGNYNSNGIPWSVNLVESVRYTNSALYHAIKHSLAYPEQLCFAPVSGMHHATPRAGQGFCTFSGQAIASLKLFDEFAVCGAWLDLDGHFGNSIEDTRSFAPRLDQAVPLDCNVNPFGMNADYVQNFREKLEPVRNRILNNQVHYVVFAHGADSHVDDDLGGQCDTEHWLQCADVFTHWVEEVSQELGKPLPVTLALFGGYRRDDYNIVLDLHLSSIERCRRLCGYSSF
ncbi:MAG: hypothetical protein ACKOJE_05980 [Bacteroidota bacterium]